MLLDSIVSAVPGAILLVIISTLLHWFFSKRPRRLDWILMQDLVNKIPYNYLRRILEGGEKADQTFELIVKDKKIKISCQDARWMVSQETWLKGNKLTRTIRGQGPGY